MDNNLSNILLQKIERIDAFEERVQIQFENISIKVNEDFSFTLFCEIKSRNGSYLSSNVLIECVLYNNQGAILAKEEYSLDVDEFFGFEILDFPFFDEGIASDIGRIRLYPKKIT